MIYLLDTVALVRHFSGLGTIGQQAANIFDHLEAGSDLLLISVVSLMEVMYLSEKNRIQIKLAETLEKLQTSECYAVVDLNAEILKVGETIHFRELHDRLILATARYFDVAVLSSDREFQEVEGIEVVWS